MRKFERLRKQFREKLERKELIVAPGVGTPLQARLVEMAGFEAVSVAGMAISHAILGLPDTGLASSTEMATAVRNVCMAVDIPVITDMDTGYGNAINAMRTLRLYENAGICAFHIEDQVSPKKCGHMAGKLVISQEEMEGKIKALVRAREDENLVIIARTDARAPLGNDEARKRGNAYAEAGADVIYLEAPRSVKEIEDDIRSVRAPLQQIQFYGGKTPILPLQEWKRLGYAIIKFSDMVQQTEAKSVLEALRYLKSKDTFLGAEDKMMTMQELCEVVGTSNYVKLQDEFLPTAEILARYGKEKGQVW